MTKKQVMAEIAAGTYGLRGPKNPKRRIMPVTPKDVDQPVPAAPVSALLPPSKPTPPPRKGVFLDLTDCPDLDAWLQETCNGVGADVSAAIIELLEARRAGLLEMKA